MEVAICGAIVKNPLENDRLCATAARLFKYVIPDYLEDFAFNLRHRIADSFEVVVDMTSAEKQKQRDAALSLQALYGEDVLPNDLLNFLDVGLARLACSGPADADVRALRAKAYQLLYRHLLKVESKPIVTRFWLFTACVFTILRMMLL